MKTALNATVPQACPLISQALKPDFNMVTCFSLQEALAVQLEHIDLILCEVSFDHYHMLDLLKYESGLEANKNIPFICINVIDNPWSVVQRSVAYAKEFGARGFIEACYWRKYVGDDAAAQRLQMYLQSLLTFSRKEFTLISNGEYGYHFSRV
jgi:hypothetical protein